MNIIENGTKKSTSPTLKEIENHSPSPLLKTSGNLTEPTSPSRKEDSKEKKRQHNLEIINRYLSKDKTGN